MLSGRILHDIRHPQEDDSDSAGMGGCDPYDGGVVR